MCYGKHKVLPILWMARDSHKFPRPNSYATVFIDKSKRGSIIFHYRSNKHSVKLVENFLASEESQSARRKFSSIISELVTNEKERERIFNAGFESFIKHLVNQRNKLVIKLIVKRIIPSWILGYYKTRKTIQYMVGDEATSSSQDTLNEIRLSVLKFLKCYK
jgi:sulfatase maturation enzyme AslB (radical SAM superfamily)